MPSAEENPSVLDQEKPWFEKHIKFVLAALSLLLVMVVWFSFSMNETSQRLDAPLLADGLPPVPIQQAKPTSTNQPARIHRQTHTSPAPNTPTKPSTREANPQPAENLKTIVQEVVTGRPLIVDAATLIFGSKLVCVENVAGTKDFARDVNQLLGIETLTCTRLETGHFSCFRTSDNSDYASLVIYAGFAEALTNTGPLALSENLAKAAKRGMWQNATLPNTKSCIPN